MGEPTVTHQNKADVWRYLDEHYGNHPGINLNSYEPDDIQEVLDLELSPAEVKKLRSTIRVKRHRSRKYKSPDVQVTLSARAHACLKEFQDDINEWKPEGEPDKTYNDIIIEYFSVLKELSSHSRDRLLVTGNFVED